MMFFKKAAIYRYLSKIFAVAAPFRPLKARSLKPASSMREANQKQKTHSHALCSLMLWLPQSLSKHDQGS
jgi:hypothetical protein